MLPLAVAVSVVIVEVPPILRIALLACVNPPVPERAVEIVKPPLAVMLLLRVTPFTATLLMVRALPLIVWELVLKV